MITAPRIATRHDVSKPAMTLTPYRTAAVRPSRPAQHARDESRGERP
jgi:hypothetical protein